MQVTARAKYNQNKFSLASIKTFLIWSFTLTVCFLVVGFPLGFVLASIGVLITVALHAVMPVSSVLLVGSIFLALNVLVVLLGAATLTFKGIKPQDVSWLSWLHGTAELQYSKTYASCPLTCEIPEGK
ncbi:MAG: hypothetical protein QNJ38_11740 [Prochloraceae cyanobacterium]|nr:hypothetical protein [Prochloraceae cyanobacterium]